MFFFLTFPSIMNCLMKKSCWKNCLRKSWNWTMMTTFFSLFSCSYLSFTTVSLHDLFSSLCHSIIFISLSWVLSFCFDFFLFLIISLLSLLLILLLSLFFIILTSVSASLTLLSSVATSSPLLLSAFYSLLSPPALPIFLSFTMSIHPVRLK